VGEPGGDRLGPPAGDDVGGCARFHGELDDLTSAEIEQRYYLQLAEADAA